MRTELKIGVTVVLVVSVMVLVYFVFFAKRESNTVQREPYEIAGRREANRAAPGRGDRGRVALTPARPPAPTEPPGTATGGRTPATVPAVATRPAVETIVESDVSPARTPPPSAVSVRTETPPPATLLPAVTPPPARAVLSPVRPGSLEANAVRPAAATGLVHKADGKDYYTVQRGDNGFWGIAAKPSVYGDGRKWDLIANANKGVDPSRPPVGKELVIPPAPRGPDTRPALAGLSTTRPAGASYTVKAGDTLDSIARTRYGNGALWQAIAKVNPGVDPLRLPVGKELALPAAEEARRAAGLTPDTGTPTPTTRPALARQTAPTPAPARPTPAAPARSGWD